MDAQISGFSCRLEMALYQGEYQVKHNLMLTITSLLSILFMTLHLTSDTVTPGLGRPRQGARPSLWCPSWSSGCTERWCSPNGGRGTSSCSNASAQFREDDGHSKVKV